MRRLTEKGAVGPAEVAEALLTVLHYDDVYDKHIKGRKNRTTERQLAYIIEELGEFLQALKKPNSLDQAEELMDAWLQMGVLFRVWARNRGVDEFDLPVVIKQAAVAVEAKLSRRWLEK